MAVELDIFKVARQDDLAAVVEQVSSHVSPNREVNKEDLSQSLRGFLDGVFHTPNSSAVAFVDRRENNIAPILDIYVLWSRSIKLSADSRQMLEIDYQHAEFFEPFNPSLKSFSHIVDPRRYPTAEVLSRDLAIQAESAAAARVIACANFVRS